MEKITWNKWEISQGITQQRNDWEKKLLNGYYLIPISRDVVTILNPESNKKEVFP